MQPITLDKLQIKGSLQKRERLVLLGASFKPSAVLLPIFTKDHQDHILFTKRTQKVEHHKGQISLPGGARDEEDRDLLTTALRESHEEMGIQPQDVSILGVLDDVATNTGFAITPFVGTIPYPYPFAPFAEEIDEVLEVPVAQLIASERLAPGRRLQSNGTPSLAYEYEHNGHVIWGATAKIIHQFLRIGIAVEG